MTETRAAELLSQNLTAIYGYAFARLYDKYQVDDLVSEIIYEIISSAKNIKNDDAFWGFAWKVAEHTFRRFIRRADLNRTAEFSDGNAEVYEMTPEQEYIEKETQSEEIYRLRRELSLLTKIHREVCVAYYIENKSCSDIAKEQKISIEMVKYHLFKTRKLLKEGIGMTRTLGEKSYNPGIFRLDFWGDVNKYSDLFKRRLPGSIVLAAYYSPMTAEELSMELGVVMPYLEEEIEILEKAGIIKKIKNRYQANIVIITDDYEKYFVKQTASIYNDVANDIYNKILNLLPEIRKMIFLGNDYDNNRFLFGLLNIAMMKAYQLAYDKSPIGQPLKLALGGNGWVFGYDNNYTYHHFNGITMETWNKSGTAWFSAENYRAVSKVQLYDHCQFREKAEAMCDAILGNAANKDNGALPYLIENGFVFCNNGILSPNFMTFEKKVFDNLCDILSPIIDTVANCMTEISDKAEKLLAEFAPDSLKAQCKDIAKIHHRLDVAAFLMECLIDKGRLTVPNEKTPLCVWGVKNI